MRKLRVFLCHATEDKPAVRKLYASLKSLPWIDPWLDEENLLPGQDWDLEIYKATRDADAIIICLSTASVKKEGYVNKEIRRALNIAEEKPEGTIYVIPLRLDNCIPSFEQLKKLQWADYFTPDAHERLLKSLRLRADALKISVLENTAEARETSSVDDGLDLYRFIKIEPQKNSKVNYPFWIGKYPVTNAQYARFLKASDYANTFYWIDFPKFDESCTLIGTWEKAGIDWLKENIKSKDVLLPRYWDDLNFGKSKPNNPVVGISWYEANAYCEWLSRNWLTLSECKANPNLEVNVVRLPLEKEWVIAAGGDNPEGRFPWDKDDQTTLSLKEILRRTNIKESEIKHTTPVNQNPLGKSPFGIVDMAGNVWEWQANYYLEHLGLLALRGGSWMYNLEYAYVETRDFIRKPNRGYPDCGFRVICISK